MRRDSDPADRKALADSIGQLDELFLLVVAGEFNSGKSAFINALLGEALQEEGVTPTTDRIYWLKYGEGGEKIPTERGVWIRRAPVDLLQKISIVDTPGTNAIMREHEALTAEFIPRSDLVLFITSADRPFTESERNFLAQIKEWGKKIVLVTNAHPKTLAIKMAKTGVTDEFDQIVCADEIGVAKEEPIFWEKLAERLDFAKERTLLADDNEGVLASAKEHGIANLIFVAKSSSKKPTVYSPTYPSIIFFKELMD